MFATPTEPNRADYLVFLRSIAGISANVLPDASEYVDHTLTVAQGIVNTALEDVDAAIYTLAVYNLAADRLINYAQDQDGQSFFKNLRAQFNIGSPSVGVVASTSDQGTSTSLLNPEALKGLTLADLQTLKTPFGRQYMAFAQTYGPTIWGVS